MAEEAAALVEYILVTESGEQKNTSVEFTGKGKATYPNGDVYEGEFVNGVSQIIHIRIVLHTNHSNNNSLTLFIQAKKDIAPKKI